MTDETTILMAHTFDHHHQQQQQQQQHNGYGDTKQLQQLSDLQENILALVPIPTALLSILGSVTIILMADQSRRSRKWTPYTRLLIGMNVCDIILSIHLSIGNFLRPQVTSHRAWAFGNDATCSASGSLAQFSYSAIIYNGMFSFYFLLAARFGMKNATIAQRVKPIFLHLVSLGFPLLAIRQRRSGQGLLRRTGNGVRLLGQ
jgi:hypothetical protein